MDVVLHDSSGGVHSITAILVDRITGNVEGMPPAEAAQAFGTAEEQFQEVSGEVQLLLGTNVAGLHPEKYKVKGNLVWAKSKFGTGHIVYGTGGMVPHAVFTTVAAQQRAVDFLTGEGLGTEKVAQCPSCARCKECTQRARIINYRESTELKMIEDGLTYCEPKKTWICEYPATPDFERLSDNKQQVAKLNKRLEERLVKTGDYGLFMQQFNDAVQRGVFRKLPAEEESAWTGVVHYVSFQIAYKEGSTTPLRICQNSAIPFRGLLFNDCPGRQAQSGGVCRRSHSWLLCTGLREVRAE